MSATPLRIIAPPAAWFDAQYGDMWPCRGSAHVIEGRAPCWVIRLTDKATLWHTNGKTTDGDQFWTVTGEPPAITVTPSINIGPEIWHGTIANGCLEPCG